MIRSALVSGTIEQKKFFLDTVNTRYVSKYTGAYNMETIWEIITEAFAQIV